jgi:hypothetical protein
VVVRTKTNAYVRGMVTRGARIRFHDANSTPPPRTTQRNATQHDTTRQHLSLYPHAAPRFAHAEPYVLASYLQDNPHIAFLDLRQATTPTVISSSSSSAPSDGSNSTDAAVAAAALSVRRLGGEGGERVEVRMEGAARGPAVVPAGAVVVEGVVVQCFDPIVGGKGGGGGGGVAAMEARQVVIAPGGSSPGMSFAVPVDGGGDGENDQDITALWPLRAVFGRRGEKGNVKAERMGEEGAAAAAAAEEGKVVYRLVAVREIGGREPLVLVVA